MTSPLQSSLSVALLAASLGLAFAACDAQAVTKTRSFFQNATGTCQSALPVFDGQIRKRPLTLQNEGTASAFINCSLMSTDRSVAGMTGILVAVDNNSASPVAVTCTLVTGLSKIGIQQFLPQTVTLIANSGPNEIAWSGTDNGGQPFNNFTVNVSCNLPPGAGLSYTLVRFEQEIGT